MGYGCAGVFELSVYTFAIWLIHLYFKADGDYCSLICSSLHDVKEIVWSTTTPRHASLVYNVCIRCIWQMRLAGDKLHFPCVKNGLHLQATSKTMKHTPAQSLQRAQLPFRMTNPCHAEDDLKAEKSTSCQPKEILSTLRRWGRLCSSVHTLNVNRFRFLGNCIVDNPFSWIPMSWDSSLAQQSLSDIITADISYLSPRRIRNSKTNDIPRKKTSYKPWIFILKTH